jgi:thiazole synthase
LETLLRRLELRKEQVAVERNLAIVPRHEYATCQLEDGDKLEIVTLVGGGALETAVAEEALDRPLTVGGYTFKSRLFVGTGKYASFSLMRECLEASGTECVTVAVRRVNLTDRSSESLLDYIDRKRVTILPNTAGCYTAEDAVRYARLSREVLGTDLVKLEVLADEKTLLPEPIQTLAAAKLLVKEGFTVLCYTSDDPVMARYLEAEGVASVMPAGSPIGSGQGVLNPNNLRIILEQARVPVICDAGVGTASDVAIAMELGCEGVLLNTGIAHAEDPLRMAYAMKHACQAGRMAYLAGRIPKKLYATASSPIEGRIARS